jgi:hypothetical protein
MTACGEETGLASNKRVISLLLAAGAIVGAYLYVLRSSDVNLRLIRDIKSGDYREAMSLLDSGADANTFDTSDRVAGVSRFLKHKYSPQNADSARARHKDEPYALQLVCSQDSAEPMRMRYPELALAMVTCLVRHGARVNVTDDKGCSPLWYSVFCRRADIANILLKGGADPNTPDTELGHMTPLFHAHRDCAQLLVQFGADVNATNRYRQTPLMTVDADTSLVLLRHGAAVSAVSMFGETPINCAITQEDLQKCAILLRHGARAPSLSAPDLLFLPQNPRILALLKSYGSR